MWKLFSSNVIQKAELNRIYALAFDEDFYKTQLNKTGHAVSSPSSHYKSGGWMRGLDPNPFFSTSWYLKNNPDVSAKNTDPLHHYIHHGAREERDPSPAFSTSWYVSRYVDVRNAGVNPLLHFLEYGRREGRQPLPSPAMQLVADKAELYLKTPPDARVKPTQSFSNHHFRMNQDVAVRGSYYYEATASDPQFILEKEMPAGFYRVKLKGTYTGIRPATKREAAVEFFVDQGRGFRQSQAYVFPIVDSVVNVDFIVFAEADIKQFRIDPINTYCVFDFTIMLTEVGAGEAIGELYSTFEARNGLSKRPEDEFLAQLQWCNIANFFERLSGSTPVEKASYQDWIARRRIGAVERKAMREQVALCPSRPTFSVLMPTYKSDLRFLKKAIDSVRLQIYPHWQLCIVDDGSQDERLRDFLIRQAHEDNRIITVFEIDNKGISAASNEAFKLATGEFIALLDHDDELAPHALLRMAEALNAQPDADMLYSDEDKIDIHGVRSSPFFKPDWSPEFFMSCMYTCHLGVYRSKLVEEVGGFRSEFDFAQDYDLAFRVSAAAKAIVHVSDVLYHWRTLPASTAVGASAKPTAELAARRAVQAHLDATGLRGKAVEGALPGTHRVKLEVLGAPLVSIVIPTAARRISREEPRWYVLDLLTSIRQRSTYKTVEFIVVENGDIEPRLEKQLAAFDLTRVLYEQPIFNIAEKLNMGVAAAKGEFVILLNDDMTIITPDWIEELVSWIQRPGIVASGPKLLFPDNTVQHAGIIFLAQGPSHVYYGAADVDAGLVGSAVNVRNYSAVTGACLAVRRQDYLDVGGFDTVFRVNYNDADFCLKLSRKGRIVYTPFAKLTHYESVSKDEASGRELKQFNERWSSVVGYDPYYSEHFSQSVPNTITWNPQPLVL